MKEKFEPKFEEIKKPHGISFVTPLEKTFSKIEINYPENELSVLKAFSERNELRTIIGKSRHFKKQFPETFNGILLGNPKIVVRKDGSLLIQAEKLHYQTYFAAHELKKTEPDKIAEKYCALSVCGIIYDNIRQSFYLSVRPENSQEDPGKIDAPGGVINPSFEKTDPFKIAGNRFAKKLGLENLQIASMGVERIFDDKYSLYNIAMYSEVDDQRPTVDEKSFAEIPLAEIDKYLRDERLTAPARATILLALGHEKFKNAGWGKARVEAIMKKE